ncbi:MAG: hypothetical protein IJV98_03650 [Clostridia bacterium]|nr:hypothetical protein [Clostridia bacterium]
MKKKILSLVLAVLMLVSVTVLTSCEKETAYSLVSGALEKMETLDSFDATIDMKMKTEMELMGEKVQQDIPMSMAIKASGIQADALKMTFDVDMEVEGEEVSTKVYQEGEWVYMEMFGMGIKMKQGDLTAEYDGMAQIKDMTKPIPEEVLADVEIVKNDDGTKTVTAAIPDDQMQATFPEFADQMVGTMAEGVEIDNLSLTNGEVSITVDKNGYIAVYEISFSMSLDMDFGAEMGALLGTQIVTLKADVEAVVVYNNAGEPVTVTPMAGYEDFAEVNAEDLGL